MHQPESTETLARNQLSAAECDIVRQLLYYHIFSYPLSEQELVAGMRNPTLLKEALNRLIERGVIFPCGDFYSPVCDEGLALRRIRGNEQAQMRMADAFRYSRRIGNFPFVRAVMVSGSLSKGYMEKDSDIDYFIITEPGRLWLARTFLVLYKKLFLFNSRKNFCVNYFIDTDHLLIPDHNEFTATEVVTLMPTLNPELYEAFRRANDWAAAYYPLAGSRLSEGTHPHRVKGLKRLGEWMYRGRFGNWLDNWCMKGTIRRWRKKFPHFSDQKLQNAMRSRKYVSKHHPLDFQSRVLEQFRKNLNEFELRHELQPGSLHG